MGYTRRSGARRPRAREVEEPVVSDETQAENLLRESMRMEARPPTPTVRTRPVSTARPVAVEPTETEMTQEQLDSWERWRQASEQRLNPQAQREVPPGTFRAQPVHVAATLTPDEIRKARELLFYTGDWEGQTFVERPIIETETGAYIEMTGGEPGRRFNRPWRRRVDPAEARVGIAEFNRMQRRSGLSMDEFRRLATAGSWSNYGALNALRRSANLHPTIPGYLLSPLQLVTELKPVLQNVAPERFAQLFPEEADRPSQPIYETPPRGQHGLRDSRQRAMERRTDRAGGAMTPEELYEVGMEGIDMPGGDEPEPASRRQIALPESDPMPEWTARRSSAEGYPGDVDFPAEGQGHPAYLAGYAEGAQPLPGIPVSYTHLTLPTNREV